MEEVKKGIACALYHCLGLKEQEQLVIVTDTKLAPLSELFYEVAYAHGNHVAMLKITGITMSGTEPPKLCSDALRSADVAVVLTEYSISYTRARQKAAHGGTRMALLPEFTEEMLKGPMMVDYEAMGKRTYKLSRFLDSADTAYLITEAGTELTMSLEERAGFANYGIYRNPGECGNLPAGESYIAPQEGTAKGKIVVDNCITNVGKLEEPITLTVEKGLVTNAEGGKMAEVLWDTLTLGGKGATNIAELGIGTNDSGVVTGIALADEKILGYAHIGLGDNMNYGGRIDSKCHLDCVLSDVTLYLDDVLVVDKGKIVI